MVLADAGCIVAGIWYVTALAYQEVTHSYGVAALEIPVSQLLILMGASMAGSMLANACCSGRLADADHRDFIGRVDVSPGDGASCGILWWLGDLRRSHPTGFGMAHFERLSLRKLSEESHQADSTELTRPSSEPHARVYYVGTP